jgi:Xaa-Pro aminopeptidase
MQKRLFEAYLDIHESTRKELKPDKTVSDLDKTGKEICIKHGFEDYHIKGISHGIGLRFEENPASTIIPAHGKTRLQNNMTVTVGHTILAVPGIGGVRFEDIYRITDDGGEAIYNYPFDYIL